MPPACVSERRELAQRTAVDTVRGMRAMSWGERHAFYYYMTRCARNDAECDFLLGKLGCDFALDRRSEFVAFVLSYVRDMMGADELIEGQNVARCSNLADVSIPPTAIDPAIRTVGPPPWLGGLWYEWCPRQTVLEEYWGPLAIRCTQSSWKGAKKQTTLAHWIHKDAKGSKTDRTKGIKKDHTKDIKTTNETDRDTA